MELRDMYLRLCFRLRTTLLFKLFCWLNFMTVLTLIWICSKAVAVDKKNSVSSIDKTI